MCNYVYITQFFLKVLIKKSEFWRFHLEMPQDSILEVLVLVLNNSLSLGWGPKPVSLGFSLGLGVLSLKSKPGFNNINIYI